MFRDELDKSLETLNQMAEAVNAKVAHTEEFDATTALKKCVHVRVALKSKTKIPFEVRCLLLGGTGSGKSTLVATLATDSRDDGKGKARLIVLRHKHELNLGRTSSVATTTMPYNSLESGGIRKRESKNTGFFFDCNSSVESMENNQELDSIVSLIDVAGHPRYIKTTLRGLMSYKPHCVLLTIPVLDLLKITATEKPQSDTLISHEYCQTDLQEFYFSQSEDEVLNPLEDVDMLALCLSHVRIARQLGIQIAFALTKAESNVPLSDIETCFDKFLKAAGFRSDSSFTLVSEGDDFNESDDKKDHYFAFLVSSITSEGLGNLRQYLGEYNSHEKEYVQTYESSLLHLSNFFNVGGSVGVVAGGVCEKGQFKVGDLISIGPNSDGLYTKATVASIRTSEGFRCDEARAGQTYTFSFEDVKSFNNPLQALSSSYSQATTTVASLDSESFASLLFHSKNSKEAWRAVRKGAVVVRGFRNAVREFSIELADVIDDITIRKLSNEGAVEKVNLHQNFSYVVYANAIKQTAFVTKVCKETTKTGNI